MPDNNPDNSKEWLTISDISAILKICRETARKLITSGRLRALDVSKDGAKKPLWRVHIQWFEEFVNSSPKVGDTEHCSES